jgi:hypothetical protein
MYAKRRTLFVLVDMFVFCMIIAIDLGIIT